MQHKTEAPTVSGLIFIKKSFRLLPVELGLIVERKTRSNYLHTKPLRLI
jgi:hypothetical protein